jgi:fructokinase
VSLPRDVDELRIGVDLGGTKVEAVVVRAPDASAGAPEILARRRVATGSELGYENVLRGTASLVRVVAKEAGLDPSAALPPVGVGMPGSRTRGGLVKNSNTTCLNGMPFEADLRALLGGTAVAFANDANCFAVAEATWGAARGARVAFGVILGTGVGGGVVLTDAATGSRPRAWDGAQGIAGEWGHVPLEPRDGPPCYCGRRGCVETYLSGPALEAAYEARAGRRLPLREIATSAARGEEPAASLLDERVELFGRALAVVIDVLDPDVVVIGGGVSNLDVLYAKGPAALERWTFTDALATRLVKHALGDSAGVLGAALLL